MLHIDLNSPGELQVYDCEDNVTGLVDGKVKENIPHSFYRPMTETVLIFGDEDMEDCELRTRVVGVYEDTFGFSITSSEDGVEKGKFKADDIKTDENTTHQFIVNWDALMAGGEGVSVEVDADNDGEFEDKFTTDTDLTQDELELKTSSKLECEPNTLNLDRNGNWITCYIELPNGYYPWLIDGSTVTLNGVHAYMDKQAWAKPHATDSNTFDYDEDGITERMIRFDSVAVQNTLAVGESIELLIQGSLRDYATNELVGFSGSDYIRTINKAKKKNEK